VSNPWQSEFQRIAGLALLGAILGALIGHITLGLLLVLVAYLAWHLYNMFRLLRWLRESKKFQPPEASGIWDDAFEHIFRLQQRNRKRKHNLRRMLKRFHKITVARRHRGTAAGQRRNRVVEQRRVTLPGFSLPARQRPAHQQPDSLPAVSELPAFG